MKKLIFSVLVLSGCYTIIKHPEIRFIDSNGETYVSYISYKSNCERCHSTLELSQFYNLTSGSAISPWDYYSTPWWLYRSKNDVNDTVTHEDEVIFDKKQREFGSRRAPMDTHSSSPLTPTRIPSRSSEPSKDRNSNVSTQGFEKSNDRTSFNPRFHTSEESETQRDRGENTNADQTKEGEKRNIGSRRR